MRSQRENQGERSEQQGEFLRRYEQLRQIIANSGHGSAHRGTGRTRTNVINYENMTVKYILDIVLNSLDLLIY